MMVRHFCVNKICERFPNKNLYATHIKEVDMLLFIFPPLGLSTLGTFHKPCAYSKVKELFC